MKNDKTTSSYLSTTQAAQRLGLSVGTVQRMVESGVLQAYTTQGGHRRILSSSLHHYCRGAAGAAEPGAPVCVLTGLAHSLPDAAAWAGIPGLQFISNPLELAGLRHSIHVIFMDARISWLPWEALHLADSLGPDAHCVIYNSGQLPAAAQAALQAQASLYPGDVSADLVQGFVLGLASSQPGTPHPTKPNASALDAGFH